MNPCWVQNSLTFINISLSGKDHFLRNCELDWCTHCLSLDFLVNEEGARYHTVIDNNTVVLDESYSNWQTKCSIERYQYGNFNLLPGAVLVFEDCEIANVRYQMPNFVRLDDASLHLMRTKINRTDNHEAFIYIEAGTVTIDTCLVTGLNRDHPYDRNMRGAFLSGFSDNLTIKRSIFREDLVFDSSLINSQVFSLVFMDSLFDHCAGEVNLNRMCSPSEIIIRNVTFVAHYARYGVLSVSGNNCVFEMTNCNFTENLSETGLVSAWQVNIVSFLFQNNRMLKANPLVLLWGNNTELLNCIFTNNGAFDTTFPAYWADYYIENGLLNDNGLSVQKAQFLVSSQCTEVLKVMCSQSTTIINATFSDNSITSCNTNILLTDFSYTDANLTLYEATLERIFVDSFASYGIKAELSLEKISHVLSVKDSTLERTAMLLALSLTGNRLLQFYARNVHFQRAAGNGGFAPVFLSSVNASFLYCHWRYNTGVEAGALTGSRSSYLLQHSEFLNNSCISGPGDVQLNGNSQYPSHFRMSNCTFTDSKSFLSAAALVLRGSVSQPVTITNCTFAATHSRSGPVVETALTTHSLQLNYVSFVNISSSTTSLLRVAGQAFIEGLQSVGNTFHRGITTERSKGWAYIYCRFNHFTNNNGSLLWMETGSFLDEASTYELNSAKGELFFQNRDTSVSFKGSIFRNNSLSEDAGMLFVQGPNATLQLHHCELAANRALKAKGVLQLEEQADAHFSDCRFEGNQGRSSVISADRVVTVLTNCVFTDTSNLLKIVNANVTVLNSTIINTRSSLAIFTASVSNLLLQDCFVKATGCLVSGLYSSVSLVNTVLEDLACKLDTVSLDYTSLVMNNVLLSNVFSNARIIGMIGSTLRLSHVVMTEVQGTPALISLAQTVASIDHLKVSNTTSLSILATDTSLNLDSCSWSKIRTYAEAGVLTCSNCSEVSVQRCSLIVIAALSVGGLSISAVNVAVRDSLFSGLQAQASGALRISAWSVLITNSDFAYNKALDSDSLGGAVMLNSSQTVIENSTFSSNSAAGGGGLYWIGSAPFLQNVTFERNTATYGHDQASGVAHLNASNEFVYLASGQVVENAVLVYLEDSLYQVVATENSVSGVLSGLELSGKTTAVAIGGALNFTGFVAIGPPGGRLSGLVSTDSLKLPLTFVFRSCELGEAQINLTCKRCQLDTFSLILNSTKCSLCPSNAECPGDGQMYPKAGAWRPNELHDGVFLCPRAKSCLGHESFSSKCGVCDELYNGNLCQSCAAGAMRQGRDGCTECWSGLGLGLQASFLGIGLPIAWFSLMRAKHRIGPFRVLVDYFQLTMLVADFDLNWPAPLQFIFAAHRYLGNAAQHLLPLHCVTSNVFFFTTIAAAISPVAVCALFGLLWLVLRIIKATLFPIDQLLGVLLVSLIYLHPLILRVTLSAFLCQTLQSEEQWLRAEMDVRCWDQSHSLLALACSLPSVLLWGIGIPALALLLFRRHHKDSMWNFLTAGLQEEHTFWAVGACFYKACLAFLYAFTSKLNQTTQALTLVLFLALVALLQLRVVPYSETQLNRAERVNWEVILATAYAGLCFTVASPSIPLLCIVLILHLWFGIAWIIAICGKRQVAASIIANSS